MRPLQQRLVRCPYCNIVVTANLLFVQKHPRKVFLLGHRNDVTGRDPRRIRKQRSHVLFYEISSNAIRFFLCFFIRINAYRNHYTVPSVRPVVRDESCSLPIRGTNPSFTNRSASLVFVTPSYWRTVNHGKTDVLMVMIPPSDLIFFVPRVPSQKSCSLLS